MGIPIEIPGLNQFIKEIPEGSIISIEGGVDHPKAILAKTLVSTALGQGMELAYIAPKGGCGFMHQVPHWNDLGCRCKVEIDGKDVLNWNDYIASNTVVLVDSFSYLMIDRDLGDCLGVLESLKGKARKSGAIVIILLEEGMLPTAIAALAGYHSDGIVQFLAKDSPDGVSRFIRVTKWMSGSSYDRNIYYNYIEGKINIDLRYRVV